MKKVLGGVLLSLVAAIIFGGIALTGGLGYALILVGASLLIAAMTIAGIALIVD